MGVVPTFWVTRPSVTRCSDLPPRVLASLTCAHVCVPPCRVVSVRLRALDTHKQTSAYMCGHPREQPNLYSPCCPPTLTHLNSSCPRHIAERVAEVADETELRLF